MQDTKNLILAIALSMAVLVGWQYFFGLPMLEGAKKQAEQAAQQSAQTTPATPGAPAPSASAPSTAAPSSLLSREDALAASPRVTIDTPKLSMQTRQILFSSRLTKQRMPISRVSSGLPHKARRLNFRLSRHYGPPTAIA
jgi:hypothetical protein